MFIEQIASCLSELVPFEKTEIENMVVKIAGREHGDFAFPCFLVAKIMKKAPTLIAKELAEIIKLEDCILKCQNEGPYLNFYVKPSVYKEFVISSVLDKAEEYGSSMSGIRKTCLLEHTSINPNASPHIGRARNAIIGDFVARILRFEGYDVKVHYFVNDIGKQISMLVWGAARLKNIKFEDLLGLYVSVNNEISDKPELEEEIFRLLYKLENGDQETRKKFREIVDICIAGQVKIFNELGIKYDCFDYESDFLFDNSLEMIIEKINEKGILFEDEENRYVVNLEKYELPPLVITRKDKTSLYPLRDIAYTIWKCNQKSDKNLIVLGQDQQLYFKQVAAVVEELGYAKPDVIHYSFVMLAEGKMSTRQGSVVLLEDFMCEAVSKAQAVIEAREGKNDDERAIKIAYDIVKYSMEKTSNERNVLFDWEQALGFEGDTAPYLLYSYVRINSIIKKLSINSDVEVDFALLERDAEKDVIDMLYSFTDAVKKALVEYSPHVIAHYAFGLAKKFSVFYHDCSILNADNEKLKNARFKLVLAVKQVLENAFYIMGLEPVNHM